MARIQVLLATLNGASFLEQQLDSISSQTAGEIDVLASDDGSTDRTLEILAARKSQWNKGAFEIVTGPGRGFAQNFRSLVERSDDSSEYFAFSDQDDVWMPEKLEQAVRFLARYKTKPCVFSSASILIDETGTEIGTPSSCRRGPGFRHAILQNIAGGNTMVMNREAFNLLRKTSHQIGKLSHDHWLYIIVTAVGGHFEHSETPTLFYRQHANNAIGIKRGSFFKKHMWRLNRYMTGRVRARTDACLNAIEESRELLTDDAKRVLDSCKVLHDGDSMISRLLALRQSGVYRGSASGQCGLWIDCAFKLK